MGLNVIAVTGLAVCDSGLAYGALNLLWGVGYNFLLPYRLGVLATLDDRGRWAVAGESLWNGGAVLAFKVLNIAAAKGDFRRLMRESWDPKPYLSLL